MISPLGTPEEPERPVPKPVASVSRLAMSGGQIGGFLDAKGALKLMTGDYKTAGKLLALMHHGLLNSLGEKGRIAGISVTVLFEVDGAHKETALEVARMALTNVGVPPIPEAKQLKFGGRG